MVHEYVSDGAGCCAVCGQISFMCVGVTPERWPQPFNPALPPQRLQWRNSVQQAVYESWDAYDAALRQAPPAEKRLKWWAETSELERWYRL